MRNRFTDLTNNMKNGIAVPSRLSTKGNLYNGCSPKRGEKGVTYNDGTCSVLVDIDSNGNAAVDKLLKDLTGFYMKNRKNRKSNFINYNISHIWGRAFDPRYFTNLWNIALVPSFANSVLDKPESLNGSYTIGAYLLNTLKAVLYKYYKMSGLNWTGLPLNVCPYYNPQYVIHGKYQIYVFNYQKKGTFSPVCVIV